MGRFRIGESSKNKRELLKARVSLPPMAVGTVNTLEIEKSIADLQQKIELIQTKEVPAETKTVIEKIETVKEIHNIRTIDTKARKYAKLLRKAIDIEIMKNDAQDERNDSQDIEIAKQNSNIEKLSKQIEELQHAKETMEMNILKEIQVLKEKNSNTFVVIGLIVSISLSIMALVLN